MHLSLFLISFVYLFGITLSKSDLELQMEEGSPADTDTGSSKGVKVRQLQRRALEEWGNSLSEETDYNATYWQYGLHMQPQNAFNHYINKLSQLFKKLGAKVNFAIVGACDGTHDVTIRERYIPNSHWNGVFVEPMSVNIRDLKQLLQNHSISDRSYVIQAAVTDVCAAPTIAVKFPNYEETKGDKVPHWLRRQIGGIVAPTDRVRDPAWKVEQVKCMSGVDVVDEWTKATRPGNANNNGKMSRKRVHVLKIDAEGFDYQVLASFLPADIKRVELPVMINFEAKSMKENYIKARELLLSNGYAVSLYGTDGFAMLKLKNKKKDVKAMDTAMDTSLTQMDNTLTDGNQWVPDQ